MADPSTSAPTVGLRGDLELSWQRHQGSAVLVVKDPVTRRYFRFTETQAAIIELMAEPLDAATLSQRAGDKLGRAVPAASIAAFFNSLEQKYLVDTPRVRATLAALGGQKLQQRNLLYWKLGSIDPERVFNWLLPRTRWAFQPAFHALAALIFASGVLIFITNWTEIARSAPRLVSVYGLILIMPMIFAVVTIHEFAHGLVCRHFGGKVHEVGFMLIYFQPAFYCDVSDSWLFPSKRDRMWVTFAGGYAQFIVWGLCALVWRVTAADALIHQAALAVLLYSGVQSLVNFNPLIKLDGYYMLSDYLEIPNLRAKAAETVWGWVSGKTTRREGETAAALRKQFIYGVAALLFSTALLLYVYAALYTWATARYRLAGLVGFAMFSTYTLRKTAAESISGIRAFAARTAVKRYRNLTIAAVLVVVSLVVSYPLKVPADFTVIPLDAQSVPAQTTGFLVEILVREGSEVKKGDRLAQMRDFDKQQKIDEIMGLLARERSRLAYLKAPPRPEEIDRKQRLVDTRRLELANARPNLEQHRQLEQTLAGKRSELARAELDLDRALKLFAADLLSVEDKQRAESNVAVHQSDVGAAEAAIRVLTEAEERDRQLKEKQLAEAESDWRAASAAVSRPEEIKQQQDEIARLDSQRLLWERELAKTEIRAPIDGVVSTPHLEQKRNHLLNAGDEFCRIDDVRRVTIEMLVPEKEMADVDTTKIVWMRLNSFPDEEVMGHVDFIAPVVKVVDGQRMMVVRSEVENPKRNGSFLFKSDMAGRAKIYCGDRRIADLMTRRFRQWIHTDFWGLW